MLDFVKLLRYFVVFLFLCLMFVSCAYADDSDIVTPTPAVTVVPSLFDDEEDSPDVLVSPDSVPVDDYDSDTESPTEDSTGSFAPDSGDSGDGNSSDSIIPTPDPTVTPTSTSEPVSSSAPVLIFQITEQPESVYCDVGDTACFTCTAIGVDVTWSWEYSDDFDGWHSCDEASAICPTLEVEVTDDIFNRCYRCTVENGFGSLLVSDEAYLYPVPDGYTDYGREVLTVLGYILGLLVFFAVVVLVKAVFRFFNIFF